MENYRPQGKRCCTDAITSKAAGMDESKCCKNKQQQEMACAVNNERSECPGASAAGVAELGEKQCDEYDDNESLEYRCPGTMDILSGRMVPCGAAPTLREIALGRRMRRTVVDYPECQPAITETRVPRRKKIHRVERTDERNDQCSCTGNGNNSDYPSESVAELKIKVNHQKPESCCGRKKKVLNQEKCVTFDK